MPALVCQPVSVSASRLSRHRFLTGGAVLSLAALLSACAPMPPSSTGAIVTNGVSGMQGDTAALANIAPPVGKFKDPAAALKAQIQQDQASEQPAVDQQGIASWYGPGFHGRKTANGERFNQYELTAAHPTYAFGTQLCVRSKMTGQAVVVRVNDRGPFVKNRVIDLSKAAAEEIGMLGKGVKAVEIYKLGKGEDDCPEAVLEARG